MTESLPFLDVRVDAHVAIIRMNRPDSRNALSAPGLPEEFEALAHRLNGDLDVRAAILTGVGPAFSAGGNIKTMLARNGPESGPAAAIVDRYTGGIQRMTRALANLDVPIIAAVNGPAMGAGLDLACMCDIRIAAVSASFAESFIRLGLVPGDGGAWFLPRLVGSAHAREMAFTGDAISSRTALEWGLVSRVVEDEMLMEVSLALAQRIARNPPYQLRFTKRLFRESIDSTLDATLQASALYQALAHRTDDHVEGVQAALEKRRPTFSGR